MNPKSFIMLLVAGMASNQVAALSLGDLCTKVEQGVKVVRECRDVYKEFQAGNIGDGVNAGIRAFKGGMQLVN